MKELFPRYSEISKNDNGTNQKTAQEYQKRAEDFRSDIRRLLRARYILTNIISYDNDKEIQSNLETSSKSILKDRHKWLIVGGLSNNSIDRHIYS